MIHTEKTLAALSHMLGEAYEQAAIYRSLWLDALEQAHESLPETPEYGEYPHISDPVRLPSRQSEAARQSHREHHQAENMFG